MTLDYGAAMWALAVVCLVLSLGSWASMLLSRRGPGPRIPRIRFRRRKPPLPLGSSELLKALRRKGRP